MAFLVLWADRRFRLGHGRAFALYVAAYCVGRGWIEHMRSDFAHHILGLRLNDWTAIIVFVLAVVYMVLSARLRPGREEVVEPGSPADEDGAATSGTADAAADGPAESGTAADPEAGPEQHEARAEASEEASKTS